MPPRDVALLVFAVTAVGFLSVDGQLAAVYSNVSRTNECSSWSSWGPCIWPDAVNRKTYMAQLKPVCRNHWFFKFINSRYQSPLNSFFDYFLKIMKSTKPCGFCSYKQSCGYGGKSKCNMSPFEIPGGRAIMPFFVSEKVCNRRDLRGMDQTDACVVDYDLVKRNGGECKLWPTPDVSLEDIEAPFRSQIANLNWYSCLTQTMKDDENPKQKPLKVCRCCCYPFKPNPFTFKCEHIPGAPQAPGMDDL